MSKRRTPVAFALISFLCACFGCDNSPMNRIEGKWTNASGSTLLEFADDGTFKIAFPQTIGPGERKETVTLVRDGAVQVREIISTYKGVYVEMEIRSSLGGTFEFTDQNNLRAYIPLAAIPAYFERATSAVLFDASMAGNTLSVKGRSLGMRDEDYRRAP